MREKKLGIVCVFVAVVLQNMIVITGNNQDYQYTFAIGLAVQKYHIKTFLPLCNLILPSLLFSFVFCEKAKDMMQGYAKLLIIRNVSKSYLLLKSMIQSALWILALTVFIVIVYFVSNDGLKEISGEILFKSILLYFLTNICIMLLEYLAVQISGLQFGNWFSTVFIFAGCCVHYMTDKCILIALFFPGFMFGFLNGAFEEGNLYYKNVGIILVEILLFLILNLLVYRKKDVF